MIDVINNYLSNFDLDVRKTQDARFMDQKVTPDVLSFIADCVLNFTAGEEISFTKNDIWYSDYFKKNVMAFYNKPDPDDITTSSEYDKFVSQPLRTLAYSGVLNLHKDGATNFYSIAHQPILDFIALKERSAYLFLYHYIVKVLSDSSQLQHFEHYKDLCHNGRIDQAAFSTLKSRFQSFIIGNTAINGTTEVNRIFPKVLNIYACDHNVQGSISGRLSQHQIYFTDLMYNRPNWRDVRKSKSISRTTSLRDHKALLMSQNETYSNYQIQKAMNLLRRTHKESEVKDQWSRGDATQVHHIFTRAAFPQLAHYLENLIKLTPTQHFTKAHPNNDTNAIDRDYQLVCLLAKSYSIENSLKTGNIVYSKPSFIHVINTGLSQSLPTDIEFRAIRAHLTHIYNSF